MTDTASSNDPPMAKPVGARLVHVAFPVNVRTTGTVGTYQLWDDIALRNSTRS